MVRKSVVLVAFLVVFAGCSGLGTSDQAASGEQSSAQLSNDGGDRGGGSEDGGLPGESGGDDGDRESVAASVDRALIKTGQVTVEVENVSAAQAAVTTRAAELGGYVSASDVTVHRVENTTWRSGHVEVRVPSENFTAMVDSSRGQGTVLSAKTETKDVTDQLVDLNARLENLRAQREQLRTLYERANSTEELLQVQERLSTVQGEIERLEAQKQSLEDRVAFSTVKIELEEPRPERAPGDGDETPFLQQSPFAVFVTSVQSFVGFGRTLLVAGVAAVPWVVGLGVPAVLAVRVGRRFGASSRLPIVKRGAVTARKLDPRTGRGDGQQPGKRDEGPDTGSDPDDDA